MLKNTDSRENSKSMHVMCEGKVESERYKDSDGKTHNIVRINASNIIFLEKTNNDK